VRRLERLGFQALATTSSGCAWSLGYEDGETTLEETLAHFRLLCSATALPINADFENGFADDLDAVARNVAAAVETGIAGLSLEDRARRGDLYSLDAAVARVAAAHEAIAQLDNDVVLVARCEAFLTGRTDLDEVIERLRAFSEAGADCVYAPGVLASDDVRRLVAAVAPVPVNVLLHRPETNVAELRDLGVRRVSVGGVLAKASWSAFDHVALSLARDGALPEPQRAGVSA